MTSPAEQYAESRRRAVEERSALGEFRGLYDFGTAPATPFRDEAADSVEDQFGADLFNWRERLPSYATRPRLDAFLAQFCPKWADWASEMLRRMR